MNPQVDQFIIKAKKWQKEFDALRNIVLECKLEETIKWKHPCYTLEGANIVLIHGFKAYCALLFFKGALINDTKAVLVQQTEQVQSARQIRFTNLQEIVKQKAVIKSYIKQAIDIEKSGAKVETKKTEAYPLPEELTAIFKKDVQLKKAFSALTPGRQRAYILFFDGAKQSATRIARIEKSIPKIMCGKGLNDCTCGLSKRMPTCDGSHKFAKK
jgi:uncharacterized protein YdeI (YjbR/CyaY-like superfamily)